MVDKDSNFEMAEAVLKKCSPGGRNEKSNLSEIRGMIPHSESRGRGVRLKLDLSEGLKVLWTNMYYPSLEDGLQFSRGKTHEHETSEGRRGHFGGLRRRVKTGWYEDVPHELKLVFCNLCKTPITIQKKPGRLRGRLQDKTISYR